MKQLQLDEKHRQIVMRILAALDDSVSIFVFGSRSKGTARPLSDLDLCLKGQISKTALRKLREDFEESNLPFKVDVVLWDEIGLSFQDQIKDDLIPLQVD